jgi:superfamily I DNA/RNA helicase
LVQAELTFTAGNNETISFGIYSSDYGGIRPSSIASTTYTNTAGTRTIMTSAIEEMNDGDYVEVHIQNNTATTNVTVAHLSLTVTEV